LPDNYILEYWNRIQSGEIIVSKRIYQLYQKVVTELENPKPPFIFDIEHATRPITFIETFCRNSKAPWAGKPIELLLWQKAMIQVVYGFVHFETGLRRAREVFIICGRKNGKSVLTSGLGLFGMLEEGGAQVTCISTKKDAAMIVFNEALNMVRQSPYLSKHIRKRKSDMYMEATFSTFVPLSSKTNTLDGLNSNMGITDEIGAIRDRDIYDVIKQSQNARQQPMMFGISTAGFVREGLFDKQYQYGCNVLDGVIDNDAFLPFFYELDEKEEINNPDMWIKANPSLGIIKSFDGLKADVEKAKVDSSFMPTVLTKDFNIPQQADENTIWVDRKYILNCFGDFDIEDFRGSYAIGGMDLSLSGDLTALTLILQKRNQSKKYIYQHYFLPIETLEKHKNDNVPYLTWEQQRYITFCQGNKINQEDIIKWWEDCYRDLGIIPPFIGYDRWGAVYVKEKIKDLGFQVFDVGQGFKDMSNPMKDLGLEFEKGDIVYNNPILRWNLTNVVKVTDPAGNIKFDKAKAKQRIDGVASLITGWKIYLDNYNDFINMIK
jgi:phage terminase large subunit-like protein